jgi:flagellar basal-body rod protein FlgB
MMINKLDEALRFHQVALSLRSARQELLASNIANADTPGYKARDIDFSSALQNAMAGSAEKLPMATIPAVR